MKETLRKESTIIFYGEHGDIRYSQEHSLKSPVMLSIPQRDIQKLPPSQATQGCCAETFALQLKVAMVAVSRVQSTRKPTPEGCYCIIFAIGHSAHDINSSPEQKQPLIVKLKCMKIRMKDFPLFRDVEYLRGEGKPGKLLGNTEHLTSFLATRDRRGKHEGTRQVKAKPGP